jgi:hypothetical protein
MGPMADLTPQTFVEKWGKREGGTERSLFLSKDVREALAEYLEVERPKDAYELERRLGYGSQCYLQLYTNPPEDVAAGYVEEF